MLGRSSALGGYRRCKIPSPLGGERVRVRGMAWSFAGDTGPGEPSSLGDLQHLPERDHVRVAKAVGVDQIGNRAAEARGDAPEAVARLDSVGLTTAARLRT